MRIGELAALAGVSTRTVRHYHHLGLLPEPERLANGYREYRLRDAVVLARIRRLAELGVSLEEIRDVLADDQGRELREVLLELDADLASQEEAIRTRRERLAALLAEADLHPDSTVAPDMAAVLRELSAGASAASAFAALDREMLTLVYSAADAGNRARIVELLRPLTDAQTLARGQAFYARLDEIADADPGDPRVAALAADLADHLPADLAAVVGSRGDGSPDAEDRDQWLDLIRSEASPAQAEVFRLMAIRLKERA
jgi:DNA-binding transcriptional MerR regulator